GVLVEKAKTTPDAYPLSLNALVTGSNQKSNRDPLLNVSDEEIEEALAALQRLSLVSRISGGRVERWRHLLYEAWKADKVELAVLGELLLRGPQTEGELRGRASRMEPIDDLDSLRVILKRLTERNLVVYLTPEGRRGTVVTHGFHDPAELPHLRRVHGAAAINAESSASPAASSDSQPLPTKPDFQPLRDQIKGLETVVADLRSQVDELKQQLEHLKNDFQVLKQSLGE
ncbi:MAG TPA: DUF480 domain-containing protein, partial [Gemmataceae bacterium]|nr:DUF480 domain-containing protein [Gemmataceae bacterium]